MSHALLLTDVVDSTTLSERLGDAAMARVWAAHDRVARDLLVPHHGREIDKTDGFLLLFDHAADAVAYALAYHRAIGALDPPLRARAGLHVGPVILTANAPSDVARGAKPLEVDGLAKPTAARIMSLATGGQTLLSAAARAALGDTALRVVSHGHWRMKGVADPVELFEVGDRDTPMNPPADGAKVWRVVLRDGVWLPVREVVHRLPAERDAFVGRAADLRALADQLDRSRLVSVLGMGGTGKTRLVTRFAWTWLGDFPGGAWFCDLSEARSVEGICAAVAATLDVPLGQEDPVVQLGNVIASRGPCLVVLDNFEQVARHAPETVGSWLDRARDARFVVTTREVLGLPGESALALAPLAADDAVSLFVTRARQAKQDFEPDDPAAIRALVELLDDLPLAIELAAARVRLMPPKTLLERMSQRFKLLASTGGRHTRQATLRATLDWSWDLLTEDERSALAQLSVFEGGFTLEAAEQVLSLTDLWPTDAIQSLVDRSWVVRRADDRFDLLVSVQEYAAEKLDAAGDRDAVEVRHGATFERYGTDEALDALGRHEGGALGRALAREIDNVIAACRRATARGDGPQAVNTLRAAWQVLELAGPASVGVDLARAVCAMPSLTPARRGLALIRLGAALNRVGSLAEARAALEQAVVLSEGPDAATEPRLPAAARIYLGGLHYGQSRQDEARDCYERALTAATALGDHRVAVSAHSNLGSMAAALGRDAEAGESYARALALARRVGNRRGEAQVLLNIAVGHHKAGRPEEADAHLTDALAAAREVGDRSVEALLLGNRGVGLLQAGRTDAARDDFEAALRLSRAIGARTLEATALLNLGNLRDRQGHLDEAIADYEHALAIARELGALNAEALSLGNLGALFLDLGRTDEARAPLERALHLERQLGSPMEQACWLWTLARLEATEGSEGWRALADEAVEISAPFPPNHAEARSVRARLRLAAGDVAGARQDVDAAKAIGQTGPVGAAVASMDARVGLAEGRLEAARAAFALAETEVRAAQLGARSAAGRELADLRSLLDRG